MTGIEPATDRAEARNRVHRTGATAGLHQRQADHRVVNDRIASCDAVFFAT
jgi:predicted kinase